MIHRLGKRGVDGTKRLLRVNTFVPAVRLGGSHLLGFDVVMCLPSWPWRVMAFKLAALASQARRSSPSNPVSHRRDCDLR